MRARLSVAQPARVPDRPLPPQAKAAAEAGITIASVPLAIGGWYSAGRKRGSGPLRAECLLPAAAGAYGARRGAGLGPAAKSPLRGCLSLRPRCSIDEQQRPERKPRATPRLTQRPDKGALPLLRRRRTTGRATNEASPARESASKPSVRSRPGIAIPGLRSSVSQRVSPQDSRATTSVRRSLRLPLAAP